MRRDPLPEGSGPTAVAWVIVILFLSTTLLLWIAAVRALVAWLWGACG